MAYLKRNADEMKDMTESKLELLSQQQQQQSTQQQILPVTSKQCYC